MSTMLIDKGESCHLKGLRTCEEHEKRYLIPKIVDNVCDWAKTNGAMRFVASFTDPREGILRSSKQLATMLMCRHCNF